MRGKKPTNQQVPRRGRGRNTNRAPQNVFIFLGFMNYRAPPPLAMHDGVVGSVGLLAPSHFRYSDISSCTRPHVCTQVMF